eukprot:5007317-Prymnesium_polylepis.1
MHRDVKSRSAMSGKPCSFQQRLCGSARGGAARRENCDAARPCRGADEPHGGAVPAPPIAIPTVLSEACSIACVDTPHNPVKYTVFGKRKRVCKLTVL